MGGKCRHSKKIASILESYRTEGQVYLEPFVGGAWVLGKMTGERHASDLNQAMITYYKAIQDGWIPPIILSAEEYLDIKTSNDQTNPITAFAMVGCSFGGKYADGYAKPTRSSHDYAGAAHRNAIKHAPAIKNATFSHCCYEDHNPNGMLIYCDPPYANTAAYKGVKAKFDSDNFWNVMRVWSKNNTVIISEYTAPSDFNVIAEFDHILSIRSKNGCEPRTEKLFMHRGRT